MFLRTLALLIVAAPLAALADGVPLTVALAKAYAENPALEAARAGLRAVDEGVPLAKAAGRPRLRALGSYGMQQTTQALGDVVVEGQEAALRLEQTLYDGGAVRAGVAQAEAEVVAARARLASVEQDVLLAAVRAYAGVLRAQRVLEAALANERRLTARRGAAQSRFRFGQLTRTDVALAEAGVAAAEARRYGAEAALRAAGAAFQRVIGDPPGTLVTPGLPANLPTDLGTAIEAAAEHPDVITARHGLEAAEAETDIAVANGRPRLVVSGEAGYGRRSGANEDWHERFGVGTSFVVPLYEGGGNSAVRRRVRERVSEHRHLLDDASRRVDAETVAAWEDLRAARASLKALARGVRAATLALDGVRIEADVGARGFIDLLDAEQEAFEAEVALALGQEAEVVAAYRLLAASGRLSAETLALDVSLYDPTAYYREVRGLWLGAKAGGDRADKTRR